MALRIHKSVWMAFCGTSWSVVPTRNSSESLSSLTVLSEAGVCHFLPSPYSFCFFLCFCHFLVLHFSLFTSVPLLLSLFPIPFLHLLQSQHVFGPVGDRISLCMAPKLALRRSWRLSLSATCHALFPTLYLSFCFFLAFKG